MSSAIIDTDDIKSLIMAGNSPIEVIGWVTTYLEQHSGDSGAIKKLSEVNDMINSDFEFKIVYNPVIRMINMLINISEKDRIRRPEDPVHVLKNMHLYTQSEVLTSIRDNPTAFSNSIARNILGYYISEYRGELQTSSLSSYIFGMMFNVPKIVIDNIKRTPTKKPYKVITEHFQKYETPEFDLKKMLIDAVCEVDFDKHTDFMTKDYIIAALGHDVIVALGNETNILPKEQREYYNYKAMVKDNV
jgi:hypothetical protein